MWCCTLMYGIIATMPGVREYDFVWTDSLGGSLYLVQRVSFNGGFRDIEWRY